MNGKKIRLARFRGAKDGPGIIVPIDHGLTMGPLPGLRSTVEIASWISSKAIAGIIAHKGMIERLADRGVLGKVGVMVHLNGMSTLGSSPDDKERLTEVETAVRLGADAVSVQVNFTGTNDASNLMTLGSVVDDAQRFALPVLAMLYDKVETADPLQRRRRLRHLARIAVELGIDALKLAAPTALEEIPEIIDGIVEDLPIYFAGGALSDASQLHALARETARAGCAGLCVGRNVFQHPNPGDILEDLAMALMEGSVASERTVSLAGRRPSGISSVNHA